MGRLVLVSNRLGPIDEEGPATGGLVVMLRDSLRQRGGLWFGWSGALAQAALPPKVIIRGKVTYATLDLSEQDHADYYRGFANGTIWPLVHSRLSLVDYNLQQFEGYMRVNRLFALHLAPLLQPTDIVWVHDYHLMPLAEELRRLGVKNRIGFFLHTPFPAPDILTALPKHTRLMRGLTEYDLIGLQTEPDLRNFLDYFEREERLEIRHDRQRQTGLVRLPRRWLRVGVFPVGIDADAFGRQAAKAAGSPTTSRLLNSLTGRRLIIGVDRLDYSKGLPLRMRAVEHLFAAHPAWRSQATFLQIAPVSRGDVAHYRQIRAELEAMTGHVNGRFSEYDWTPIRYLNKSFGRQTLAGFYRCAGVGLVTPLRDGMNLVAKEYVAAQDADNPGILVLSRFAGAAQELSAALLVNPFDVEETAAALHRALGMSLSERRDRWQTLMAVLRSNSSLTWGRRFIAALQQAGTPAFVGDLVVPLAELA